MTIQEKLLAISHRTMYREDIRTCLSAADRIEALEAALRDIIATDSGAPRSMQRIAREALEASS